MRAVCSAHRFLARPNDLLESSGAGHDGSSLAPTASPAVINPANTGMGPGRVNPFAPMIAPRGGAGRGGRKPAPRERATDGRVGSALPTLSGGCAPSGCGPSDKNYGLKSLPRRHPRSILVTRSATSVRSSGIDTLPHDESRSAICSATERIIVARHNHAVSVASTPWQARPVREPMSISS